jgi:cell division protein FtsL
MLILLKKIWIINGFLIVLVVSISLLSVYWHHQMYLLHKKEKMVIVQNEQIVAINRQLKMERSELQSGVIIYKKSQNILLMHSPSQIKELSL